MSLMEFSGLLAVYLLSLGIILSLNWQEFMYVRFNFHLFFTLVFLITFYFGFPLTSILVFRFDTEVIPQEFLLQALLSATAFYMIYYVACKVRLIPVHTSHTSYWLKINRVETQFTCIILIVVAIIAVAIFFTYNGLLIFRLGAYDQIFSKEVSGIALKRFFYFFIPGILIPYFLQPTVRNWVLFLIITVTFGLLTYALVGGTRANVITAFSLFLFIGVSRGWIRFWMLFTGGIIVIFGMFWLALRRYNLHVIGKEAFYTFLYLTRDTFSPWENLALLLQNYHKIEFQGLAPLWRDFYVFIPSWLWPDRPLTVLNSANYFTWYVLNHHSGLAISPTLIGSFVVMGGVWAILPGAIAVGLIIKAFDALYRLGQNETNRYKGAILQSFCFGAVFNIIVLAREGFDAFSSRVVFFFLICIACRGVAKLLFLLLDFVWLIRSRE